MSAVPATILILGAASDLAMAMARGYARRGHPLILAARHSARLESAAAALGHDHGVAVRLADFDALDPASFPALLDGLGGLPDTVVCAVGLLGDHAAAIAAPERAELIMRTNYLGPTLVLGEVAARMERRGHGTIIGISSVAGERGRASNYLYGSAKAGFTAVLSGLRNRLHRRGVRVVTVKPGYLATRMTAGRKLPPLLTTGPDEAAAIILRAVGRGAEIVYVGWRWRVIVTLFRLLPEGWFKRTRF